MVKFPINYPSYLIDRGPQYLTFVSKVSNTGIAYMNFYFLKFKY